jgi:hypothetical protein
MKPPEYRNMLVLMRATPYTVVDGRDGNLSKSGTLSIGRVIWMAPDERLNDSPQVFAYAENLGRISISRDDLSGGPYAEPGIKSNVTSQ